MNEEAYTILRLGGKDASDVAALEALCFSLPWSEEQYRALLSAAAREASGGSEGFSVLALGARAKDGRLVGYVLLGVHHGSRELEVYNIAVREGFRQNGLGRVLLAHALGAAYEWGIERAVLEVRAGNAPALALYEKFGFTPCGRRKGYYADTGEDALVMQCDMRAVCMRERNGPLGGQTEEQL